jgi:hypothetical protein
LSTSYGRDATCFASSAAGLNALNGDIVTMLFILVIVNVVKLI